MMAVKRLRASLASQFFGLLSLSLLAAAAPMQPWDNFVSPCPGGFLAEPSAVSGYKLWSSPATWPGGEVPGIGSTARANVSIPCGTAVLLDVPLVNLTILNIRGLLRVLDTPSLPSITIHAAFIIVEGQLYAGTPSQHFSQRLTFNLVPNPANRAEFRFTANAPADPLNARNFGHKAFVVVGGQVRLHGMPGGSSTLSYTKLSSHIRAGNMTFFVSGNVMAWPDESRVLVSTTDFDTNQNEVVFIKKKELMPGGLITKIYTNVSFGLHHFGDPLGIPDGFGGFVDQLAEVALLDRNIVITGTDEPAPNNLHGGHFMIFHTATPQFIEGVNFFRMGQQGILGRYSIHFHLAGNQERTLLRRNLILDSKQRCVVIHASFNLTVEENVAYNNFGHCYLVEEGGEANNTFLRNLGVFSKPVSLVIPNPPDQPAESDAAPATFWISSPTNHYIGNIAVAAGNTGFWFELQRRVRGNTRLFPPWNNTVPLLGVPGIFKDNVAHSNFGPGMRYYPFGYRPRFDAFYTYVPGSNYRAANATNEGFNCWRHDGNSVFVHFSDHIVISNGTFSDNRNSININHNQNVYIIGNRFVGVTPNYGNPSRCNSNPAYCGPVAPSCVFPIPPGLPGRTPPGRHWAGQIFGVVIDQTDYGQDGYGAHAVVDNKFSFFDPTCRLAAGIGIAVNGYIDFYWTPAHLSSGMRWTNDSLPIWFPAYPYYEAPGGGRWYGGEPGKMYAWYDRDGSLTGGKFGYVVANVPGLLPPQDKQPCVFKPLWVAWACPNVCYRNIFVLYNEANSSNPTYLRVSRLEGGPDFTSFSNGTALLRVFPLNLAAGYTYEINIESPLPGVTFNPPSITVRYYDGIGCGQGLTLRFPNAPFQWAPPDQTEKIGWRPCRGAQNTTTTAHFSYVCHKQQSTLQVELLPNFPTGVPLTVSLTGITAPACSTSIQCALIPSESRWAYNPTGAELHAFYPGGPAFYNPLFDESSWPVGQTPIGAVGWYSGLINTWTVKANPAAGLATFYFRKNFTVTNSRCITGLYLDVAVDDGVVVYLNNIEIIRPNMPAGNISTISRAWYNAYPPARLFSTYFFPVNSSFPSFFIEGTNYLAAETHLAGTFANYIFDARVWVTMNNDSCSGRTSTLEVCDGLDNDGDGTVDINPSTGRPFQRPCSTACGRGTETCIRGAFQGCTAPKSFPEICNGIDDDCNGLVDEGPGQLDCPSGLACYRGQCLQRTAMTIPVPVVTRGVTPWFYYETGGYLYNSYPRWTVGDILFSLFKTGTGPFTTNPSEQPSTQIASLAGTRFIAQFFLTSFNLTAAQVANTSSLTLNVRRDDGAIIYLNGAELWRTNMPTAAVSPNLPAASGTSIAAKGAFFTNTPFTNTTLNLKAGLNWLAVDLRQTAFGGRDSVFDMDLIRNTRASCSSLPGSPSSCVRMPSQNVNLIVSGSRWRFLDASMPLPPTNWHTRSFNDSSWKSGISSLGFNVWVRTNITTGTTAGNGRVTYYFRQTLNLPDGRCFYNLTFSHYAADGMVVYVNGAEAYRFLMPSGPSFPNANTPIFPTTLANGGPAWKWFTWSSLAGGFLVPGNNVIAVELHEKAGNNNYALFDMTLVGQREGVNCEVPIESS